MSNVNGNQRSRMSERGQALTDIQQRLILQFLSHFSVDETESNVLARSYNVFEERRLLNALIARFEAELATEEGSYVEVNLFDRHRQCTIHFSARSSDDIFEHIYNYAPDGVIIINKAYGYDTGRVYPGDSMSDLLPEFETVVRLQMKCNPLPRSRIRRRMQAATIVRQQSGVTTLLPVLCSDAETQSNIEDCVLFLAAFLTCKSRFARGALLLAEIKKFKKNLSSDDLTNIMTWLHALFIKIAVNTQDGEDDFEDDYDDNENASALDRLEAYWKKFANSDLAKSLGKVVVFLLSLYKFGLGGSIDKIKNAVLWCGADRIFQEGDMFLGVLRGAHLVVTKVWQFFQTGSMDDLFHTKDSYVKFDEEYKQVRLDYVKLRRNDRTVDRHGLLGRVRDLIDRGNRMMAMTKKLKVHHEGVLDLFQILLKLEEINNEMSSKIDAQKPRMTPIGLLVVGKSSVGKSSFMRMLHVHLCRVRKKERVSLEDIYVRNPEDPYYTGHDSTKITIIVDDAAIIRPARVQGVDKSMNEIVFVVNTVQAMPLYASLEDKGMNPIMCEQFIISSNVEDLNIPLFFSCPLAIARRLPYKIEIRPREEFCKPGTQQLDGSKVPNVPFPDVWWIVVSRCTVMPGDEDKMMQNFKYERVSDHDWTLAHFLPWYTAEIRKHFDIQGRMLDSNEALVQGVYCPLCDLPETFCSCHDGAEFETSVDEQGGEILQIASVVVCTNIVFCLLAAAVVYASRRSIKEGAILAMKEGVKTGVTGLFTSTRDSVADACSDATQRVVEVPSSIAALGEEVAKKIGVNWKIVAAGAAISGAISAWMMTRVIRQGNTIGVAPPPVQERESCWKRQEYTLSTFDIPRKTMSYRNMDKEFLVKFFLKRICFVKARKKDDPTRALTSSMLCVKGNRFISTGHTMPRSETQHIKLEWTPHEKGITMNHEACFNSHKRVSVAEDVFMYDICEAQPRQDIGEMFMPRAFANKSYDGMLIGRRSGGEPNVIDVKDCHLVKREHDGVEYDAWETSTFSSCTIDGDCGSVLVLMTHSGPMVAGCHRLMIQSGFTTTISSVAYFKEDLPPLDDVVSAGEPKLHSPGSRFGDLTELHPMSDVRFVQEGRAEVFGSFPVWRSKMRSKMHKTVFYDDLVASGIKLDLAPAVLGGWKADQRNLMKLVTNNVNGNEVIFAAAAFAQEQRWSVIVDGAKHEIFIYDMRSAINGVPGRRHVDRIEMNTSAGFPYCTSKKNVLVLSPTEDDPHNVELSEAVKGDVEHIYTCYRKGVMCHAVFQYAKKDEMRPLAKVEAENTRGINGASVGFTLVMRQLTLGMTRVMQLNPDVFSLCVGLEAQTAQWEETLLRCKARGYTKWIAIDFTGFDSSFLTKVMRSSFTAIRNFMKRAGATEEHLRFFDCMAHDLIYYMVNFRGTLMQLCGKNPSGHAWTVIINSIANEQYMLYSFVILHPRYREEGGQELYNELALEFYDNVLAMFYGDDNAMAVSDDVPWFNHTAIKQAMTTFGVTVTMADKTAESRPYITEDEVTFLKRRWRYDAEFGKRVAPLEMNSIFKSLMWNRYSDIDSPEETLASCVMSQTYEFAWHGREVFERETERMWKLCDKYGIKYRRYTFDYFVDAFKKNSQLFKEDMEKRGKLLRGVYPQGGSCEWDGVNIARCEITPAEWKTASETFRSPPIRQLYAIAFLSVLIWATAWTKLIWSLCHLRVSMIAILFIPVAPFMLWVIGAHAMYLNILLLCLYMRT